MANQKNIVIATKNAGKADEFKKMLEPLGYNVKTLLDYPETSQVNEDGSTFEENAKKKADHFANELKTPVIADDSGLSVDYLDGAPGVKSARYAGDHDDAANNAKLLSEMSGVPQNGRNARFTTVLVAAKPNDPQGDLIISGKIEGAIAPVPRGDNGFGYDSLFLVPSTNKTFGEMNGDEKSSMSHRGNAVRKLNEQIDNWYNN